MESILVTGDIVLDCHLYGGVKTAANSFGGPGTTYAEPLGGAALTHALVTAAASTYEAHLGIDIKGLKRTLPKHLRSYGVWTERPAEKGRVWRVQSDFGYGPVETPRQVVFQPNPVKPSSQPLLTLIDDGAILFRHGASNGVWPEFPKKGGGHFILKTTSPLCRGDLWAALEPVMDRLIVVVSADDLRREDAQVNSRLSWEQCVEHTVCALRDDPIVKQLGAAAHVIVSFGSAGALWAERGRGRDDQSPTYHLVFDPNALEGDHRRVVEGTVYGFQTCLAAGIAHHLMQRDDVDDSGKTVSPIADDATIGDAMLDGIAAGLLAKRRLLELGHGPVDGSSPGFPIKALAEIVASSPGGFERITVPAEACAPDARRWTILSQSEASAASTAATSAPLTGLAQLTARYGLSALSHVPALSIGPLFTVDRSEIESFRTLESLISDYEAGKRQEKPLSIGVFGPPGAGKSFGVKALAKGILGKDVPFLEFNLSQFKSPDELIGAFHRVRDAVLKGVTPVAFWDEFDSQNYKWLQYLLAPMQDGAFQEGQITHPIGKCVFIFAGGTSPNLTEFGVASPDSIAEEELADLSDGDRAKRLRLQAEHYHEFKLLKGPDFISRLHGFLNVLGPNSQAKPGHPDITWPIRRAIILRAILGLRGETELDIDDGLLGALLGASAYKHGARSFDKIVGTLAQDSGGGRLRRSALPPQPLLDRETDAAEFHELLVQRDEFKNYPDLEDLAKAIHESFLADVEESKRRAKAEGDPSLEWTADASILKPYAELSEDAKTSNRMAARRIPDHLALIGYVVELQPKKGDDSWVAPLGEAIKMHTERLALAEHVAWRAERLANDWTYAKVRDNQAKHHPLLVDWAKLSPADQEKDRASVRRIPEMLGLAGFRAMAVGAGKG
jgi:hypothetical protein